MGVGGTAQLRLGGSGIQSLFNVGAVVRWTPARMLERGTNQPAHGFLPTAPAAHCATKYMQPLPQQAAALTSGLARLSAAFRLILASPLRTEPDKNHPAHSRQQQHSHPGWPGSPPPWG